MKWCVLSKLWERTARKKNYSDFYTSRNDLLLWAMSFTRAKCFFIFYWSSCYKAAIRNFGISSFEGFLCMPIAITWFRSIFFFIISIFLISIDVVMRHLPKSNWTLKLISLIIVGKAWANVIGHTRFDNCWGGRTHPDISSCGWFIIVSEEYFRMLEEAIYTINLFRFLRFILHERDDIIF